MNKWHNQKCGVEIATHAEHFAVNGLPYLLFPLMPCLAISPLHFCVAGSLLAVSAVPVHSDILQSRRPHLRVIGAYIVVVVATDSCSRCNQSETPDSMSDDGHLMCIIKLP